MFVNSCYSKFIPLFLVLLFGQGSHNLKCTTDKTTPVGVTKRCQLISSADLDNVCDSIAVRLFVQMQSPLSKFDSAFLSKECFPRISQLWLRAQPGSVFNTLSQDSAFAGFPELTILNIDNHRAGTLGTNILQGCRNLRNFSMTNGPLTIIKTSFDWTPRLHRLNLNSNLLKRLDLNTVGHPSELRFLDVTNNPIMHISTQFSKCCPQLRELFISGYENNNSFRPLADVSQLMNRQFSGFTRLEILHMTRIQIQDLSDGALYGLSELKTLELGNNLLESVDPVVFESTPRLLYLGLTDNRILCLFENNFRGVPAMRILKLSRNRLKFLSYAMLRGLDHLTELHLDSNPLKKVETFAFCRLSALQVLVAGTGVNLIRNGSFAVVSVSTNVTSTRQAMLYPAAAQQLDCSKQVAYNIASHYNVCVARTNEVIGGTQQYLGLIIAICLIFLVACVIAIIGYRWWSRGKSRHDDEEEAKALAIIGASENGGISHNMEMSSAPTCSADEAPAIVSADSNLDSIVADPEVEILPQVSVVLKKTDSTSDTDIV